MKRLLKKMLVAVVISAPLFISTDCKKQKQCGCGKDIIQSPADAVFYVYFKPGDMASIYMTPSSGIDIYTLCNPDEILPKLEKFTSGAEFIVSGDAYWDCNYVMQASNYGYNYDYRTYYNIRVTDIELVLYGKK
ncbi:MAG: hypothetical protein LBV26_00605 [Bacteroidales bacterium]|jgi:hypothetical protein|nr:hypothetical protein [Bacteroidales bacterium]